MNKITVIMLITINLFSWEINTHRAIDHKAIQKSQNLASFLNASNLENYIYEEDAINFEGYNQTFIEYILYGEKNGLSQWNQTFSYDQKYSYSKKATVPDLIEAGSILEDAQYPGALHRSYGRFNNHFYDAQNKGHKLSWTPYPNVNALKWTTGDTYQTITKFNYYSYYEALSYFKLGFTESDPAVRKKYQAKMLVSVGHLLHMVNDMNVPAHVRDDTHPFVEPLEIWARGGDEGNRNIGFRMKGNRVKDSLHLLNSYGNINLPYIPKHNKFSDFITQEATWTATHFFSDNTIFTKPLPSVSTTYEDFSYSLNKGTDLYYIKSLGDGAIGCRNGCVPTGTKLAIRIKSYITRGLKRYLTNTLTSYADTRDVINGDYSVIKDNAKVLIPRAIANARNFLDYFFRGRLSAEITNTKITLTNDSRVHTVKDENTIIFDNSKHAYDKHGNGYYIKYEDDDGTLHNFSYADINRDYNSDLKNYDDSKPVIFWDKSQNGFWWPAIKPQHSISIPIELNAKGREIMRTKKIIVFYQGYIGESIGSSVCYASTDIGIVAHRE